MALQLLWTGTPTPGSQLVRPDTYYHNKIGVLLFIYISFFFWNKSQLVRAKQRRKTILRFYSRVKVETAFIYLPPHIVCNSSEPFRAIKLLYRLRKQTDSRIKRIGTNTLKLYARKRATGILCMFLWKLLLVYIIFLLFISPNCLKILLHNIML